jgi:hypothetical protein
MTARKQEMDDTEIEELFAGLGAVTIKRLFGGKGSISTALSSASSGAVNCC